MNTYELQRVIGDYVKRFDGVFSINRLPTKPRIVGVQYRSVNHAREHWIAIYVDDDGHYGEYFDSLGRAPKKVKGQGHKVT